MNHSLVLFVARSLCGRPPTRSISPIIPMKETLHPVSQDVMMAPVQSISMSSATKLFQAKHSTAKFLSFNISNSVASKLQVMALLEQRNRLSQEPKFGANTNQVNAFLS